MGWGRPHGAPPGLGDNEHTPGSGAVYLGWAAPSRRRALAPFWGGFRGSQGGAEPGGKL